MDTRTGQLYDSREAALAAGVPAEFVEPAETQTVGEIVTITSGPFKGRSYRRTEHGLRRVRAVTRTRSTLTVKEPV